MKSKDLRKKLIEKSAAFREAYFKRDLALEISHMLVRARIQKGFTQKELADLIGTKQPAIARAERGNTFPDINFLERIANALETYLFLEFKERETQTNLQKGYIFEDQRFFKLNGITSPYYSHSNASESRKFEEKNQFL